MRKNIYFLIAVCMLISANSIFAQVPELPLNSKIRKGTLENGLTYYIVHNESPKGEANFYFAQKSGAVQENSNQNGLAQFLEGLSLKDTEHFPDNNIKSWLKDKKVKVDADLKIKTYTDKTIYQINNVPSGDKNVVDSCLLILKDWAGGVNLSNDNIFRERKLMHAKWENRAEGFTNIVEQNSSKLFGNSKYGKHFVYGKLSVIDYADSGLLKDYYKSWYRPDLQGVIVAGDINVDSLESKIKDIFSPLKAPLNHPFFKYYAVPNNDSPIFISQKDKKSLYTLVNVITKYDLLPREMRNTDIYEITEYVKFVLDNIITSRLSEMTLGDNSSMEGSGFSFGNYFTSNNKGAAQFKIMTSNGGSIPALNAILAEMKNLSDNGVTDKEYEKAYDEYISMIEMKYNNRRLERNSSLSQKCLSNFIDNTPLVDSEYDFKKMKSIALMVTRKSVNQMATKLFNGSNLVVLITAPDNDKITLPTPNEMLASYNNAFSSNVQAYKESDSRESLLESSPKAGEIVSEKENKELGYTELDLSNGAKVLLKNTTFKDGEIVMKAISKGGASLYDSKDYPAIEMINKISSKMGVGDMNASDLKEALADKNIYLRPYVGDYEEGIDAKTNMYDFENMMQLLYLYMTQPRYDKQEYETIKLNTILNQDSTLNKSDAAMQTLFLRTLYNNNPKTDILNESLINDIDYDRMYNIYKERFSNAGDFTFIFSGDFGSIDIRKLIKEYIASLPFTEKREMAINDGKKYIKGKQEKQFIFKRDDNKAQLSICWSGNIPYTMKNCIETSIIEQLYSVNLWNAGREDNDVVSLPKTFSKVDRTYEDEFIIRSCFTLSPEKKNKSEKVACSCMNILSKDMSILELDKIRDKMIKEYNKNIHENEYWINVLKDYSLNDVDMYTNYVDTIKDLTIDELQKMNKSLLNQNNRLTLIMIPVK